MDRLIYIEGITMKNEAIKLKETRDGFVKGFLVWK